jgi:hypothetical protein
MVREEALVIVVREEATVIVEREEATVIVVEREEATVVVRAEAAVVAVKVWMNSRASLSRCVRSTELNTIARWRPRWPKPNENGRIKSMLGVSSVCTSRSGSANRKLAQNAVAGGRCGSIRRGQNVAHGVRGALCPHQHHQGLWERVA